MLSRRQYQNGFEAGQVSPWLLEPQIRSFMASCRLVEPGSTSKSTWNEVRSLINTYRELHPQLLHRSLRGREATVAVSLGAQHFRERIRWLTGRGEVHTPQFGELQVGSRIGRIGGV